MIKKIIFSLVPLVIIFSILEIGLRLSSYEEYLSPNFVKGTLLDHSTFWKPELVERNPLGAYHDYRKQFRGVYYEKEKKAGVKRIVCLGGSSTWGYPLEDTSRIYPALLERNLNEHYGDEKFEVINAGVGGYTSFQIFMYLKDSLLEYKPDIVTLSVGANDNNNNSEIHIALTDKEYWEHLKAKRNKPLRIHEVALEKLDSYLVNSRVYNGLDNVLFRVLNKPKKRVPIDDFKQNMNELTRLSQIHDFKLVFVTEAIRGNNPHQENIDVFEEISSENKNVFFADTRPFMNNDAYFVDVMHPTYEGHEIVAEVIFKKILDKM